MGVFRMATRRIKKLVAWLIAFGVIGLMVLGVAYLATL